jgi:hypothetical protein
MPNPYADCEETLKKCCVCKELKPRSEFYDQSDRKSGSSTCKKCANVKRNGHSKDIKSLCVEKFGGKCSVCGYNKTIKSLHFHHLIIGEKETNFRVVQQKSAVIAMPKYIRKCLKKARRQRLEG